MPLYAFKDGLDVLDEGVLNGLLTSYSTSFVYDGTGIINAIGTGTTENNLSTANYAWDLALGRTSIGRIELNLKKYGSGADLTIEVRSGMGWAAGNDGTLLKTVKIPSSALRDGVNSIPVNITGLNSSVGHQIVVKKSGDATNHFRLYGEASGGSVTTGRRTGTSGVWTVLTASVHLNVYDHTFGTGIMHHAIVGDVAQTHFIYDGSGRIYSVKRCIPARDETWKVIQTITLNYDGSGNILSCTVT